MPLVISITLNKTESLRLHSNNDISADNVIGANIFRATSLSDHGCFTVLSQLSEKLQQICEIRDIRFRQSIDSS